MAVNNKHSIKKNENSLPSHQSNHSENKKVRNMTRTLCRNKCMAVEEKQLLLVNEVKVKVDNLIAHRSWRQSRARLGRTGSWLYC